MALQFDGVDDIVNHGTAAFIDNATAWTIMWWNYQIANGSSANDVWMGWFRAGASPLLIYSNGSLGTVATLGFAFAGNTNSAEITFTTGSWQHWAMVYDGSQIGNSNRLKFYRDGSEQVLAFNGTIPATLGTANDNWYIGGLSGTGFHNFIAAHIKCWSAALSAAEVVQEMHSRRPVRYTNIEAWIPYDDATDAKDYSNNARNGTVTGATQVSGPPVSYGG